MDQQRQAFSSMDGCSSQRPNLGNRRRWVLVHQLVIGSLMWMGWTASSEAQPGRENNRTAAIVEPAVSQSQGANDVVKSEPDVTIDCEASVREQTGQGLKSFRYALVELPALEAGKFYRLRVKVLNPTEEIIEFTNVSATCGCAKVVAERNQIPAFGDGQIILDLKVPNAMQGNQDLGKVQVGADFSTPGVEDAGFRLIVSYDLSGWFRFAADRIQVDIPAKESVVLARVPVLINPPLTIAQLELKETSNLKDFAPTIVTDDPDSEIPYVKLTIPRRSVARSGIVGELILQRPGTDQVAGAIVSIGHQADMTVRPESIRLSRDDESKAFEATAILRVVPAVEQQASAAAPPKEDVGEPSERVTKKQITILPVVELAINGHPARVQVKKVGEGGIFRLTIRYDGPLDGGADETLEVRWRIVHDGREQLIDSHAFVSDVRSR